MAGRLEEFFRRLQRTAPFGSFDEASGTLAALLNQVEDELSGVPYDPESWRADGRMYPPQEDNRFVVQGFPGVIRMRTKAHNIFVAGNGAIEIQTVRGKIVVFSKPGSDGKEVWDEG
jgi:hypothetical protein